MAWARSAASAPAVPQKLRDPRYSFRRLPDGLGPDAGLAVSTPAFLGKCLLGQPRQLEALLSVSRACGFTLSGPCWAGGPNGDRMSWLAWAGPGGYLVSGYSP